MNVAALLGTAIGLGTSAGINAYATLLIFGLIARWKPLLFPGSTAEFFAQTWVLALLGVLYAVEFVADKIPAVDHVWDIVHSFVRPLAGAVVGMAAAAPSTPRGVVILAAVLAGGAALTGHVTKASIRAVSTATTGGAANPLISFAEDLFAFAQTLVAIFLPYICIVIAAIALLAVAFFVSRRRTVRES